MEWVFQSVPAGSSIIATTPYRVVKMDLKKIMALAMLALLTLPSLTMIVRAEEFTVDSDDGAGLADAIERARLYLDDIRNSATDLATEHEDNEDIKGYLKEICDLLDQDGEEDPENLLETTGEVGSGNEDRIRINMPEGTVLNDIVSISWDYYLYSGYAPHVDIMVDLDDNGEIDDALVFEYAYNDAVGYHMDEGQPTYGCLYDAWYTTFSDDGEGPAAVTDTSYAWPTTGPAGPFETVCYTLAQWKTGINYASGKTITGTTKVLALEFEVDNWMSQTKAVIDNIKMNDNVIYTFEEEPEDLGAEGFLVQASAYLAEGDIRSAARCLASARNILGRVKGLLTSMIKIDKVARTERFVQQFEHRIAGLEDKIHRLRGHFGEGKANKAKASMGLALGRLGQLGADVSVGNVDVTLDGLCDIIEDINLVLDGLDGDTSDILEAIDRLEAKIRVLNATANRLSRKGCDTTAIVDELNEADELLKGIIDLLKAGDMEEAESLLKQAADLVSEASSELRGISKGHKNKGPKKDRGR